MDDIIIRHYFERFQQISIGACRCFYQLKRSVFEYVVNVVTECVFPDILDFTHLVCLVDTSFPFPFSLSLSLCILNKFAFFYFITIVFRQTDGATFDDWCKIVFIIRNISNFFTDFIFIVG